MHFIIGASGSGKTACLTPLKQYLPDFSIDDFDDIGVPDNADTQWRQEATEAWIKRVINTVEPTKQCLLGQMVPGEIIASPSADQLNKINIILLDCSDRVRVERLIKRNTYGINQDTLNWSAWLRMHCHTPQWEQHVIKNESSPIMHFERWDQTDSWGSNVQIDTIDTSFMSIEMVSKTIRNSIINETTDRVLPEK